MAAALVVPQPLAVAAELELPDRLTVNGAALFKSSVSWSGMAAPPVSPSGRGGIYFDSGASKFKVSEHGGPYFNLLGGYWGQTGTLIHPASLTDSLAFGRTDIVTGMLLVSTNTTAVPALFVRASDGRVGVGTITPGQALDVEGAAQFGTGAAKSVFGATGALTLAANAGLTLSGSNGNYTSGSSVTASAFFGSGIGLTGLTGTDSTRLLKAGDSMTGTLTISGAAALVVTGASVTTSGGLFGNAPGMTNLNAAQLTVGTVPSVRVSGSYTSITGVGTLTAGTWNAGTIPVLYGGTGATTTAAARSNLSAAASGSNADITALTALNAGGLADNTVYGQDIANSTITLNKLNASGCASGQVASYNGTTWICANDSATDSTKVLKAGDTMTGTLTMSGASANIISGSSITALGAFYGKGASLTSFNASSLGSGAIPTGRMTGSYTGITGVGTLTAGNWNASTLGLSYGGTGATTAGTARTNLGLSLTGSTLIHDQTGSFTSLTVAGSNNNYAGINFTAVTGKGPRLMVQTAADVQGFYSETLAWSWYFQNGSLNQGTVPGGRVVGAVTAATTATNLFGGVAGSIPYQYGVGLTGMLPAGTAGYLLATNGAGAMPSWVSTMTILGYLSITGLADASGNLRFSGTNPYISAASYIIMPGGLYVNGGTGYFANSLRARGGLHNDIATYMTLAGGTSEHNWFNGRVGLGTSSPGTSLHVSSAVFWADGTGGTATSLRSEAVAVPGYDNVSLTTEDGALPGYAGTQYPVLKSSGYLYLGIGGAYVGYLGNSEFGASKIVDFDNTSYFIDPSGNPTSAYFSSELGVGLSPVALLDIFGDSQVSYGVYDTPVRLQGDTYTYMSILVPASGAGGVVINRAGTSGWLYGSDTSGYFRLAPLTAASQAALSTALSGSIGMTVNRGGLMGLGTSAPQAAIHAVNDAANAVIITDVAGNGVINATTFRGIGFEYDTSQGDGALKSSYPGGVAGLNFYTTNAGTLAEHMRINNSGAVSLGTTNPSTARFYVQDADNATTADIAQFYALNLTQGLGIGYNRIQAVGTNANQDILILPRGTGDVGISMSPNSPKLHVTGYVGATGWIGAGCENSTCESSGGYTQIFAAGDMVVYPGAGQSPTATLGLYTSNGSLPGYPTNNYPTLKTSHTDLFFSAGGLYSAYMNSGGVWNAVSSRERKENFVELQPQDMLNRIERLEVSQWNFKVEPPSVKHIGPIAESFHEQFGLGGSDDTRIAHTDPPGVALAGIQALLARSRAQRAEISALEKDLAEAAAALERRRGRARR